MCVQSFCLLFYYYFNIYVQQDKTLRNLFYLETVLHVSVETGSNTSTIAAGSSNGVTSTRCCIYSCLRS